MHRNIAHSLLEFTITIIKIIKNEEAKKLLTHQFSSENFKLRATPPACRKVITSQLKEEEAIPETEFEMLQANLHNRYHITPT